MAQLIVRPAKKASQSEKQNIKVVVRIRPLSQQEADANVRAIVRYLSQKDILAKDKRFKFDRVFKPEANQIEIYQNVVAPMIPDVINGYNCTVFAYGQTGSGKTYTMAGDRIENILNWRTDLDGGIIVRAAAHLFDLLLYTFEKTVKVSYLELYNEEIRDLLIDEEAPLNVYNDTKGSVFIQGLTEVITNNSEEICRQLQKGNVKRQTAPTLMNHQSSRSHTVFTVTVITNESTSPNEEFLKIGKINFVDLAGSENIARASCKDMRVVELANINRSLLTLERVIHALADKFKKHVPYRDSKLTRILQDSLGGQTKTCIIATVSPAANSLDETLSTLEYACHAKDIKNSPTINEKLNANQVIESLFGTIKRLENDLEASRSGVGFYLSHENYASLIEELTALRGEQLAFNEVMKEKNKKINELENKMEQKNKEYDDTIRLCQESRQVLDELQEDVQQKKKNLMKERLVAETYEHQANRLHKEAQDLVKTSEIFSEQSVILHKKLENQYYINKTNEVNAGVAVRKILDLLNEFSKERLNETDVDYNICKLCKEDIVEFKAALQIQLTKLKNVINNFDRKLIENIPSRENIFHILDTFIIVTKEEIEDIKIKFNNFFDSRRQIAHNCILEFAANIRSVLERFQNEVHDVVRKLSDEFRIDLAISAGLDLLQKQFLISKSKAEIMHKRCLQRDETTTKHLSSIKKLIEKRQDREEMFLTKFTELRNTSRNEIDAVVGNLVDSFNNLSTITPPYKNLDKILEETTKFCAQIEDKALNLEKLIVKTSDQALDGLCTTLTTHLEEVSSTVNANYDSIDCKLNFLLEDESKVEESFNNLVQKSNKILSEEFLKNIVRTRHEGDTPVPQPQMKRNVLDSPAPREVLLHKFSASAESTTEDEDEDNLP